MADLELLGTRLRRRGGEFLAAGNRVLGFVDKHAAEAGCEHVLKRVNEPWGDDIPMTDMMVIKAVLGRKGTAQNIDGLKLGWKKAFLSLPDKSKCDCTFFCYHDTNKLFSLDPGLVLKGSLNLMKNKWVYQ